MNSSSLRYAHIFFALALVFCIAACGDTEEDNNNNNGSNVTDTTPTDTTPTDTTPTDTTPTDTTPADMCAAGDFNRVGFEKAIYGAFAREGSVEYTAFSADNTPYDALYVITRDNQLNAENDGLGTYDLAGKDLTNCSVCVLALSDCEGNECAKTYFATAGEVELTGHGGAGDSFAAELSGLVMEEAILDNGTSTLVEGGESWCLNEFSLDTTITDDATEARCSQPGVNCVGDTVPDFKLRNCEESGNFSLQEMGEGKKAIWVVLTAGWCPACRTWLPQVIDIDNEYEDLEVLYIMGEDDNYDSPSRSECRDYVNSHYDTEVNRFFLDHDGEYSFATTFSNMWPYVDEDGAFGLPWNALIDPRTMEFVYADGSGQPEDLETALNSLLSRD